MGFNSGFKELISLSVQIVGTSVSRNVALHFATITKRWERRNEDPYFRLLVYDSVLSEDSGILGYNTISDELFTTFRKNLVPSSMGKWLPNFEAVLDEEFFLDSCPVTVKALCNIVSQNWTNNSTSLRISSLGSLERLFSLHLQSSCGFSGSTFL